MIYKVQAYQVADSIDLKAVKAAFKATLIYNDSEELFYETGTEQFVYVFRYGVISFLNYSEVEISSYIQFIGPFCRNLFPESLSDEMLVESGAAENKVGYNKIEIRQPSREVMRMIMLNVSQSVTLDYYTELTGKLLEETNHHTQLLEKHGRLAISGIKLKKFIGKTLLLRNSIVENLYIFDSPPETWEDEELDKLHTGLKRTLDLQDRFRSVSEGLAIVKENLELFKDILQYRNSTILEWVIIALIAIEVVNFLIEKLWPGS